MPNVAAIVDFLKQFAPLSLAADWDNVGLLLGDDRRKVSNVMTCLTVTPASADEAIQAGAQLIISHHPIMFRPMQKLTAHFPDGKMLLRLAKAGVAVYSPHTAFDNTVGGINDMLCGCLGLKDVKPLRGRQGQGECKIVVFLPETDLEPVSTAMFKAGAGRIGDYRECSHRILGTGTFFGTESTNPTIGGKGQREEVTEWRMEVICPLAKLARVVSALKQAHSYEEPAYDVYALQQGPSSAGEGRVGKLEKPMSLERFAKKVKDVLQANCVRVVGEGQTKLTRVALACGAAGEFLRDAVRAKADVFLTGEMRFHDCLAAEAQDIAVVLPGHYATERFAVEKLAEMLARQWSDLEVWPSRVEQDPLQVAARSRK